MAKIPIRKFSFRLLIFSIIIAGIAVLFQYFVPLYASPALPFIVLFFFLITLLSLYVVLRDQGRENRAFVSGYMLSRIIKFFSCLLFLFLYIFLNQADAMRFGISFIIIYFLYSGFEIYILKRENG